MLSSKKEEKNNNEEYKTAYNIQNTQLVAHIFVCRNNFMLIHLRLTVSSEIKQNYCMHILSTETSTFLVKQERSK